MMMAQYWRFVAILAILGALFTLPLWSSQYFVLVFMIFGLYLALAQMWNLLAGYSGLISLGQQIFIGLGGYTLAIMTLNFHWPIWLSIITGGLVSVLFALIISVPIFRMSGVYFAIGSWIVAEALMIWFSNWDLTKKGSGVFIKAAYTLSINQIYYMAICMGIGSVALVYLLLRSRLGLSLMAMRDDVGVCRSIGINIFRSKLLCFLIAACVTGITSGVLFLNQVYIQPYKAFDIGWTVNLCFIVIIGGIGTIEGPIIGALIFVLFQQYLAEYASISMIILGTVSVVIMLLMPKGIMGTVQEKIGFEFLSPRRM